MQYRLDFSDHGYLCCRRSTRCLWLRSLKIRHCDPNQPKDTSIVTPGPKGDGARLIETRIPDSELPKPHATHGIRSRQTSGPGIHGSGIEINGEIKSGILVDMIARVRKPEPESIGSN